MIGLKYDIVELHSYNSEWQLLFEEEKKELLSLLQKYIIGIEHIGSTAIPGLISKPIIDIMLGLKKYSDSEKCIIKLGNIGYKCFGECGRPGRLFFIKGGIKSTHHLHLVEYGSIYWRENILFRNYLRRHKNVANEYASIKKELAKRYKNNRDAYRFYKSLFVENTLKKAHEFILVTNKAKYI